MDSIQNLKKIVFAVLLFGALLTATLCGYILFRPWTMSVGDKTIEIEVQRGMMPRAISSLLKKEGIIPGERDFLLGAKLLGLSRKLQAGRYHFKGTLNNYKVLIKLSKGAVVTQRVTIPEGSRANRIASILHESLGVDSVRFMALVKDTAYCQNFQLECQSLEGYLYPDTYHFQRSTSAEDAIHTLVSQFKRTLSDSIRKRMAQTGMTLHQVVTLASIVEGEAVLDSERPIIAALYLNRLRRRMLLQADPTIQYIVSNGPRRLFTVDLQIDSPYNTYIYPGLPPGPVNSPGLASIRAVLFPETTNVLYMVANGDGSHTFSKTINEHIRAKNRFDQVRREVRRQGR